MKRLRLIVWAVAGWVVLLALPVLWGLSYLRADVLMWMNGTRASVAVVNWRGSLSVMLFPDSTDEARPPQFLHANDSYYADTMNGALPPERGWRWLGCSIGPVLPGEVIPSLCSAVAAHWLLCIPVFWMIGRTIRRSVIRAKRKRRGLCLGCGYDLRMTPDRCPECGVAVEREGTGRVACFSGAMATPARGLDRLGRSTA